MALLYTGHMIAKCPMRCASGLARTITVNDLHKIKQIDPTPNNTSLSYLMGLKDPQPGTTTPDTNSTGMNRHSCI